MTFSRRGDFQYSEVKLAAERTFSNIEPLLKRSGKKKIYISTDEVNPNEQPAHHMT